MLIGAALAAIVVGCAIVAFGLRAWFERDAAQPASPYSQARAVQQFPSPRLEPKPAHDIAAFKGEKTEKLDGYGWIDRSRGIVQIPIARAMELMVERGREGSSEKR